MVRAMTWMVGCVGLLGCGGAAPEEPTVPRSRMTFELTETEEPACGADTVYFGYDSAELNRRTRRTLQRQSRCLQWGASWPVHFTGSADPRGTEEYNMALGERRARAVYDYLTALGVDPGLLGFSSVGEEMSQGSSEATWALDRHVMPIPGDRAADLQAPLASR